MQLGLASNQGIHLVGILQHFGVAEGFVHAVVLSQQVHDGLHAFAHHLNHGLGGVELRLLFEVAHGVAGREHHLALVALVYAGDDFQQRGLTRAVQTDDANLGTVEEREVDVF